MTSPMCVCGDRQAEHTQVGLCMRAACTCDHFREPVAENAGHVLWFDCPEWGEYGLCANCGCGWHKIVGVGLDSEGETGSLTVARLAQLERDHQAGIVEPDTGYPFPPEVKIE